MYWLAARFGLAGTIRGLGESEGVRGTRECVQGLGKERWWDGPCLCTLLCRVSVLVSFLADLVVLSVNVSLALCWDGLSCVRFAVVHPSVHSNDPDAA